MQDNKNHEGRANISNLVYGYSIQEDKPKESTSLSHCIESHLGMEGTLLSLQENNGRWDKVTQWINHTHDFQGILNMQKLLRMTLYQQGNLIRQLDQCQDNIFLEDILCIMLTQLQHMFLISMQLYYQILTQDLGRHIQLGTKYIQLLMNLHTVLSYILLCIFLFYLGIDIPLGTFYMKQLLHRHKYLQDIQSCLDQLLGNRILRDISCNKHLLPESSILSSIVLSLDTFLLSNHIRLGISTE